MKRDRVALEYKHGGIEVVLTGASFLCAKCNRVKPGSEFGLRSMPDNKIRNQPQCMVCR